MADLFGKLFLERIIQDFIINTSVRTNNIVYEIDGKGILRPSVFSRRILRLLYNDVKKDICSQVDLSPLKVKMVEYIFTCMDHNMEQNSKGDKINPDQDDIIMRLLQACESEEPEVSRPDIIRELRDEALPFARDDGTVLKIFTHLHYHSSMMWFQMLTHCFESGKFNISILPIRQDKISSHVVPGTELSPGYAIHNATDCTYCALCSRNWPEETPSIQRRNNLVVALDHLFGIRFYGEHVKGYVLSVYDTYVNTE
jgi:hypothetical protein